MIQSDVFRKVTLFSHLADREIDLIARTAVMKSYAPGDVIVWENDPADNFFVIAEGDVKVTKTSRDGKEITLSFLKKEDFFGEMALLTDEPRTATVTAMSQTTVYNIYRRDFISLLSQNSEMAVSILKKVCSRLADANSMIQSLVYLDMSGRLAGFLRKLAKQYGKKEPDGVIVFKRPTHEEIAEAIGSSRETVSRLMKELEKQGLIRSEGKYIHIRVEEVSDE